MQGISLSERWLWHWLQYYFEQSLITELKIPIYLHVKRKTRRRRQSRPVRYVLPRSESSLPWMTKWKKKWKRRRNRKRYAPYYVFIQNCKISAYISFRYTAKVEGNTLISWRTFFSLPVTKVTRSRVLKPLLTCTRTVLHINQKNRKISNRK